MNENLAQVATSCQGKNKGILREIFGKQVISQNFVLRLSAYYGYSLLLRRINSRTLLLSGKPQPIGGFMNALYYPAWGKLEIRGVPVPRLGEGEVLVRVSDCGICGSELETFRHKNPRRTPPLIMGHEFCGEIEDLHSTRDHWKRGDRVIAHALVHCGQCSACLRGDTNLCAARQVFGMDRPGAFAEYVAVPERGLTAWPDEVPAATAIFAEPLANGINAMRQGANARHSRVVVIGAGPIGLMCLFAATQLYGSSVISSDRIPQRLAAARLLGADCTVDATQQDLAATTRDYWRGNHAEFVVDAVGSAETKRLSLEILEPGGTAVWIGLHEDRMSFNSYALTLGQKCVAGSYSGSMEDFHKAARLLASGGFRTSWTTTYPLEKGERGFRDMLKGDGNKIKAILEIDGHASLPHPADSAIREPEEPSFGMGILPNTTHAKRRD